ncbi:MAG TPA: ribose 5-phosphate isomerase B [Thermodesulfobacteriota bacterium]
MSERTGTRIVVGSDHAGFPLKGHLMAFLRQRGYEVIDVGSYDPAPVDFPDIARRLAEKILGGEAERGLMVCGTGVGASIAANKIPGIRAAVCHDVHSAHQSVEHDDVNVMCIGAQIVGPWLAVDLVDAFVSARFSDDPDCRRRVAKLHEMDRSLAARRDG